MYSGQFSNPIFLLLFLFWWIRRLLKVCNLLLWVFDYLQQIVAGWLFGKVIGDGTGNGAHSAGAGSLGWWYQRLRISIVLYYRILTHRLA